MSEERVVTAHILQVFAPRDQTYTPKHGRVLGDLPAMLEEMEENLTDLLPEGWRAVITAWDAEEGARSA